MTLKVFLSTSTHKMTDKERNAIYKYVDNIVRQEYENVRDDDVVAIYSNLMEGPAPSDVQYKKLYHLSKAFNKMKDCDVFFLLSEMDGTIKPGCMIEMEAWLSAGAPQPIVRRKPQKYPVS